MTVDRDHDVIGFQIAMDDTGRMRFREAFRDVLQIIDELPQFGVFTMDLLAQRDAVDELHGDVMHTIVFTDFEDLRDAGMAQCRRRLRLANKSLHAITIGGELDRQNFQRDFAIEFRVVGRIDHTHSARTDFGKHAVMREVRVDGEFFQALCQAFAKPISVSSPENNRNKATEKQE